MEVLQQFRVIDGPHVARPNYFCAINVGSVVHPIMIEIMVTTVAHDDQVQFRGGLQFLEDGCTLQIAARPPWFNLCPHYHSAYTQNDQGATNRRYCSDESNAQKSSSPAPLPEVAHALQQDQVQQAGCRGKVMRGRPGLHCRPEQEENAGQQWKTYAAVAKCPGQHQQRKSKNRPEIELPR